MLKLVKKPWGNEIWFACAPKYVGKLISVRKGHRLSLQYHRRKDETMFLEKGRCLIELNGRKKLFKSGDTIRIKPGTVHRLDARYGNIRIIEVSTPQVRDVVRLEDDYHRAKHIISRKRGARK
ncbi:MAG TPA: cupin domain-containing protein [Elusimicrobiota bacterium]|nr:cupin domain-containing protein [Elusimicrobiota bacterium]